MMPNAFSLAALAAGVPPPQGETGEDDTWEYRRPPEPPVTSPPKSQQEQVRDFLVANGYEPSGNESADLELAARLYHRHEGSAGDGTLSYHAGRSRPSGNNRSVNPFDFAATFGELPTFARTFGVIGR